MDRRPAHACLRHAKRHSDRSTCSGRSSSGVLLGYPRRRETQRQATRSGESMSQQVDPSHIMQVGMGFWASKTVLSAVELELFTKLGSDEMTGSQIAEALELHARAIPDFPDALVALELLEREGEGKDALYRNTQATAVFLDKRSPAYIGGIFEM